MARSPLDWKLGHTKDPSLPPSRWIEAAVPGAVQLDWAKAEGWEEYWRATSFERYAWMEDVYWVYETELRLPERGPDQRIFFVAEGIDYQFLIKLDDTTVFGQEGMFTAAQIDLTELAQDGDRLQVVIFPPPDSGDPQRGRAEANASVKPPVSYGWDWHPRLIPLGIWQEAYLEVRHATHLQEVAIDYTFEDDLSIANIDVAIELSQPLEGVLEWVLTDAEGEIADAQSLALKDGGEKRVDLSCEVFEPDLWWPHDHGEQNLYSISLSVHDREGRTLDQRQRRIGLRQVRLVENEGTWEEPRSTIKSRSVPPMTLEINGRRIFAKGSNWVPPEIFPGTIDRETYRPLLQKAKEAHFNLLRCWGGGIVNKDSFFELCDELGLMVWQEFPLACNKYQDTPEYLSVLDQESQSILRRLKMRPCVVLWCGGNELFNAWSRMTDQNKALRLLNRNCFDIDPDTPFLPTSPIMGVGHGGYVFRSLNGEECFSVMQKARYTAYTEFGCPGPTAAPLIRRFMPDEEEFPPRSDGTWKAHHGVGAWEGHPSSWLCLDNIQHYFGQPESLEELVGYGEILQSEGYKALFEEARRQKPYCSMALNWCYNEAWPTVANCSLISWPCHPRPSYEAVKASCRPICASARVSKFLWKRDEWFAADLWMLNDSYKVVKGDRVEAYLHLDDDEIFVLGWDFDTLEENANQPGPTLRYRLPDIESQTFQLILRIESKPQWNAEYTFCFRAEEKLFGR